MIVDRPARGAAILCNGSRSENLRPHFLSGSACSIPPGRIGCQSLHVNIALPYEHENSVPAARFKIALHVGRLFYATEAGAQIYDPPSYPEV